MKYSLYKIIIFSTYFLPILIISLCGLIITKYKQINKTQTHINNDLYLKSVTILPYNIFILIGSITCSIYQDGRLFLWFLLPISGIILGLEGIKQTQDIDIYRISMTVLVWSLLIFVFIFLSFVR